MRLTQVVLVAILLAVAAPVRAELCPDCTKKGPYTKDIGRCTHCEDGRTLSGQFKLCPRCSDRLQQCEHCLKSLVTATQPAAMIDLKNDGKYAVGPWEYRYTVTNKGTRSEGYLGELLYNGKALAEPAAINDFYQTPWGPIYWVGQSQLLWGDHGWMPNPKSGVPAGKQVAPPASDAAPREPKRAFNSNHRVLN